MAAQLPTATWTATGVERQVFLDDSGRRARVVRLAGALAAALALAWSAGIAAGSVGWDSLPAPDRALARAPARDAVHARPGTVAEIRGSRAAHSRAHRGA